MAVTVQDLVSQFQNTYADCSTTDAVAILNEVDRYIIGVAPLRRSTVNLPLTAGVLEYAQSELILKTYAARLINTTLLGGYALQWTTTAELDNDAGDWRSARPTLPQAFYATQGELGTMLGIWPAPLLSTILISNVTTANPAVVTTSTAHGLTDGQSVSILGVLGTTSVNNTNLATPSWVATVLSPTTFSVPVLGNSAYVSGGYLVWGSSWLIQLDCSKTITYIISDTMVASPVIQEMAELYTDGMRWRYAVRRAPGDAAGWEQKFRALLGEAQQALIGNRSQPRIKMLFPVAGGSYRRGGCNGPWNGGGYGGNWGNL